MKNSWKVKFAILSLACTQLLPAFGSVVLGSTRIIYPAQEFQKSIELTNSDEVPSVMQVWVDTGDESSTPATADAPFVLTPPMFRIEPKSRQTVRIVFTGEGLPTDRESIFYFNSVQIPPSVPGEEDQNKMLILLRNRIKLFFRPKTIHGSAEQSIKQLQFSLEQDGKDWRISAKNKSGYFITLTKGVVKQEKSHDIAVEMIAPYTEINWLVQNPGEVPKFPIKLELKYVDDFGGNKQLEYEIVSTAK